MTAPVPIAGRVAAFCGRFGLRVPILLGPMAGVPAPALSAAVASAGGMGACGAVMMRGPEIAAWAAELRQRTNGAFQLNTWIPDPPPVRDAAAENRVRAFLRAWEPEEASPPVAAGPAGFEEQCAAMLDAAPAVISSVMGLYPPEFVAAMKARRIAWFATITTLEEARAAEAAGADALIAQGSESGGHRGAFDAAEAEQRAVGLFALLPAVADAVGVPVIAAGGIADGRGIAAALLLGASAVQIGTGFLRTPEAGIPSAWADALGAARPEETVLSRVFSGRAGRSLATEYVRAATAPEAPRPAPYPVQRGLTAAFRAEGVRRNDLARIQAWAGQASSRARAEPAGVLTAALWADAAERLGL